MNAALHHIDETSSKKGNIHVSYAKLVEQLGEPNIEDDPYKVDASWGVEHEDGRKLCVWNYKNGPAYLGNEFEGTIEDIGSWSYDGDDSLLFELFGENVKQ